MSTDAIFAVTRTGLDYERARMEAASRRIAVADQPVAGRGDATHVSGHGFASRLAEGTAAVTAQAAHAMADGGDAGRAGEGADASALDASGDAATHTPLAVRQGDDGDLAQDMTTLMSAQRAYQADIRAFNVLHGMVLKSLTIGGH